MIIKNITEVAAETNDQPKFKSTVWYGDNSFSVTFNAYKDEQANTVWKINNIRELNKQYLTNEFKAAFIKLAQTIKITN